MTTRPRLGDDSDGLAYFRSDALRALLEADHKDGNLSIAPNGQIHRDHYAARLGCLKSDLFDLASIFSEFEAQGPCPSLHTDPPMANPPHSR